MNVIRKNISSIIFTIFLFCAIFTPDFFPISMRYMLITICLFVIAWNWMKLGKVVINRKLLHVFKGFLPFVSWLIFSQIIHMITDESNTSIYLITLIHTLEIFLAGFIIGQFFIFVCDKFAFNEDDILRMLIIVTIMQFCCVFLALVFPEIRIYFNNFIIKNSNSERLAELAQASTSGRIDRSYGLSNNLFDSFGYITAIITSIMFLVGCDRNDSKIKITSLIMIIMPLVNARTGVVLVLVSLIVASAFYFDIRTSLKNIALFVSAIIFFQIVIQRLPESMFSWLTRGLFETQALVTRSESVGVYSKIFDSDLVLPSNLMFGDGGLPKSLTSHGVDNGYINCLWNFGMIGTTILLFGYLRMFWLSYSTTKKRLNKSISVVMCVNFYLYLFKVYSLDNFGGMVLLFGITTVLLTDGVTNSSQLSTSLEMDS